MDIFGIFLLMGRVSWSAAHCHRSVKVEIDKPSEGQFRSIFSCRRSNRGRLRPLTVILKSVAHDPSGGLDFLFIDINGFGSHDETEHA